MRALLAAFVLTFTALASADTALYVKANYTGPGTGKVSASTLDSLLPIGDLIKESNGLCYEGSPVEAIDIMQAMIDESGSAIQLKYKYEQDLETIGEPVVIKNLIISWRDGGSKKFKKFDLVRPCSRDSK